MLPATQRELRAAFQKHAAAYSSWDKNASDISKRLILIYCVECGLKYLLMRKNQIMTIDDSGGQVATHDFHLLLKQLGWAGPYSFPQIRLRNGGYANSFRYHEMCRYNLQTDEYEKVQLYDRQLEEIANAIKEVI